jgi:hypothetical protein
MSYASQSFRNDHTAHGSGVSAGGGVKLGPTRECPGRALLSLAAGCVHANRDLYGFDFRAQLLKTPGAIRLGIAARDPFKSPFKRLFQRCDLEWFRQVVEAAEFDPLQLQIQFGAGGKENDRRPVRARVAQQFFGNVEAVRTRHHHVENDNVWLHLASQR